jgi:septal ring-binding cell division protein DamX
MKTGGSGAKYFGIGLSEQYRVDQVTVNLRAVDVNSGRVINSVTTSRSVLSRQVQAGVFRFVRFKRLLEIEAGYTRNEPVQLCLLEAIQEAVLRVIVEGVEDKSWSLSQAQDLRHPLMAKYGRGLQLAKPSNAADQTTQSTADKETSADDRASTLSDNKTATNTATNSASANTVKTPSQPTVAKTPAATTLTAAPAVGITSTASAAPKKTAFDKATLGKLPEVTSQQGGRWVIQLMSSHSSAEVFEFVDSNKLDRSMYEYFYYQHNGEDRFAILYGRFYNKDQALKAIESLPPKLRLFEPWVRATY